MPLFCCRDAIAPSTDLMMRIRPFELPLSDALIQGYDAWATSYDRDVRDLGYCTPEHVADAVCHQIGDHDAYLLDVGAGTGLLGEEMYRRGYRHLMGMDASHGMLAQAARKGTYRWLSRMVLGYPLGFANQVFDGVMAAGVFSSHQVPPESLWDLHRIVRPGGWIVFSLKWDGNFKEAFLAAGQRLEEQGRWQPYGGSGVYASWPHADRGMQTRVLIYKVL
jgi:predicted TPR repeat methyltransferase